MKTISSVNRDTLIVSSDFLDFKVFRERQLIGKCRGEIFSMEGDAEMIESIFLHARQPVSVQALAEKLNMTPETLEPVIRMLLDSGLVTIPADRELESQHSSYIGSVILFGGTLLVNELARQLENLEFDLPVICLEGCSSGHQNGMHMLEESLRSAEQPLLVGVPTGASIDDFLAINALCLQSGTPWLPFYFDGAASRIGPMVIPYKTPCFGCLTVYLKSQRQFLFPGFSQYQEESGLKESWDIPAKGGYGLTMLQLISEAIHEISVLRYSQQLPSMIGRQKRAALAGSLPVETEQITFEAQAGCPACYCGARTIPDSFDNGLPGSVLFRESNRDDTLVQHDDGGLRSMNRSDARNKIVQAFAGFGTTFRITRCTYGPLSDLPSYRSHSSGYLSRDIPVLIPPKQHSGKGISEEQAFLSAAYEMAERVSAAYHAQIPLVSATPEKVRYCALDICRYLGEQYLDLPGFDRFEPSLSVDWVWAQNLLSEKPFLVPASFVFFPVVRFKGTFKPQWSGGLAAGSDIDDAILQGLMERVEHDAWAIWQLNRIGCPSIDLDTIADEQVQCWLEHVRQKGLEVIILDKRTEIGIPTFRVWIVNRQNARVFAARGDGAHLDPLIAVKRALTEAQHKLAAEDQATWEAMLRHSSTDLFDHELSLYHLSGIVPFELQQISIRNDFREIPNHSSRSVRKDIQRTIEMIRSKIPQTEIAVVDLTSPVLSIPVVRVITSGMQEMAKPWTHLLPRTFDMPVLFGYRNAPLAYHQLYHGLFPH